MVCNKCDKSMYNIMHNILKCFSLPCVLFSLVHETLSVHKKRIAHGGPLYQSKSFTKMKCFAQNTLPFQNTGSPPVTSGMRPKQTG